MQNLILTSTGFANKNIKEKFLELVNMPNDKIRVIFIPTAAITEDAKVWIPVCKNDLLDTGILEDNIVTYDLDRIMSCDEICNFNVIYVCGGTTQHLLNKMNETNFNIPLKKFLHNGGVYVGVSAGSVVLSQNLPNNLGYINCTLNVHAEEGIECGYLNTSDCPNIKLTDNQAIIITDNDIAIIE
ncbi:Type 1 glutamine amidotransferase-like domain-containing protein [Clostridium sp. OS1-26]|uniref:Type 1 glutamine amidotransferase-like domain-containing protein n=1 Tax=Clostridium sp. OS1-26 TaxID=3070681 RepID=UPI0027DF7F24|nr:Type 1 glutamine amidotransferase-like domain-containing protein [Clostridium sp. OS1-26]WML37000.1 Type 1 glutamine amidotransferase-like domain-containing protein [Clostridium sp. OS1-26]